MNEQIEKALAFDSLAEAERMTGLDYHVNDGVVALGMLLGMSHGQEKVTLLRANNDTCMQNNLVQQLEAIEGMGFRLLTSGDIPGTDDKWRIFWRDGVLLFCDSYFGDKSMNSGSPRRMLETRQDRVFPLDGAGESGNYPARGRSSMTPMLEWPWPIRAVTRFLRRQFWKRSSTTVSTIAKYQQIRYAVSILFAP